MTLLLRREALATEVDLGVISTWVDASDKKTNRNQCMEKREFTAEDTKSPRVVSSASGIARFKVLKDSIGFLSLF